MVVTSTKCRVLSKHLGLLNYLLKATMGKVLSHLITYQVLVVTECSYLERLKNALAVNRFALQDGFGLDLDFKLKP